MHCPHCRRDNAATTRFCVGCGAVLVEEKPGGGRRRVLRPWGLRKSAPLTISPDVSGHAPPPPEEDGPFRTDLWLAGAVVGVLALGSVLYPALRGPAASRAAGVDAGLAVAPPRAAAPAVREVRVAAPALVEARTLPAPPAAVPVAAAPAPARPTVARHAPAVVPVEVAPPRETAVAEVRAVEPAAVPPAAPARAAPAPDRWQALRDELGRCAPLGLLDRAMCEQHARLSRCDGYWGHAELCPAGRTEYGQ